MLFLLYLDFEVSSALRPVNSALDHQTTIHHALGPLDTLSLGFRLLATNFFP